MQSDENSRIGVGLDAPSFEIELLKLLFPRDPLVEVIDGKPYLFASALDDARDGPDGYFPEDVVSLLLPRMMTIARSQMPGLWNIAMTSEWIGYKPQARARIGRIRADMGIPPDFVADSQLAERVLQAADEDRLVADALRLVNGSQGAPNWVDSYKVCEILIDHVNGGKKTLDAWSGKRFSTIMECAGRWQVAGEGARHYRQKGDWSGRQIMLGEATDVLADLVIRWVVGDEPPLAMRS